MQRGVLVLALVGCGFRGHAVVDAGGGGGDDDAMPDAAADAMPDDMEPPPSEFCSVDGVVACYELEGNARDGSGHKHHASMANVLFVAGKVGQAMAFAATSEAKAPGSAMFDVDFLTIEAWIKPTALPVTGQSNILDVDQQYAFYINTDGTLTCDLVNRKLVTTVGVVTTGQWNHVACTHDGNVANIYLDGRSAEATAAQVDLQTGGHELALAGNSPSGSPLIGLIDQVRLLQVARSADDICIDAGKAACPP